MKSTFNYWIMFLCRCRKVPPSSKPQRLRPQAATASCLFLRPTAPRQKRLRVRVINLILPNWGKFGRYCPVFWVGIMAQHGALDLHHHRNRKFSKGFKVKEEGNSPSSWTRSANKCVGSVRLGDLVPWQQDQNIIISSGAIWAIIRNFVSHNREEEHHQCRTNLPRTPEEESNKCCSGACLGMPQGSEGFRMREV